MQYIDLTLYYSFWVEASASGVEDIAFPEVNDYISSLTSFMNNSGKPLDKLSSHYGTAVLYLYLYNHVHHNFDREIWEQFEKAPLEPFEQNLKKNLEKRNLGVDSIFQDFAIALSFSGARTKSIDSSRWISEDEPLWPEAKFKSEDPFVPDTQNLTFNFHKGGIPDIENFKGNITALLFKSGKANLLHIRNSKSLDSAISASNTADSINWVYSRIGTAKQIPAVLADSTLRAYPVPWRGTGALCFTPLDKEKEFIEIRNQKGDLVMRFPITGTISCMDEETVREKMRPGVFQFRQGAKGKMRKFLIIY